MSVVFDDRPCLLGEGPLWHPEREQLFWFDIKAGRMLTRVGDIPESWDFGECVSAAGWVDHDTLLIASETRLLRFDLQTAAQEKIAALEPDQPETRSNDGRADPFGGFWIGTMGKRAEPQAGAIYRFYRGELRLLTAPISISNAISFTPDGRFVCFTDTPTRIVMRQALHPETGWPEGEAEPFLDLREAGLNPDGAVFDAEGNLWVAQWGAARVAAYDPDGQFLRAVEVPGAHSSCPAFGGADLSTLYCTSARNGLRQPALQEEPRNGMTFAIPGVARGLPEHRVIL